MREVTFAEMQLIEGGAGILIFIEKVGSVFGGLQAIHTIYGATQNPQFGQSTYGTSRALGGVTGGMGGFGGLGSAGDGIVPGDATAGC